MALPTTHGLTAEDTASIHASSSAFAQRLMAQDADGVSGLYTADAVLMPPHQPSVHGRDNIRDWMASFPTLSHFELIVDDVDGRDDLAYVRGTYKMTLQPEGAPGPVDDVGKYIEIRRRQPDGSWLLSADIFNSDLGD